MRFEGGRPYAEPVLSTSFLTATLVTALSVPPPSTALAQPQADPSWGEDASADDEAPAEETAPVETTADDDAVAPVQPAAPLEATVPVEAKPKTLDDIQIPEKKGIGLMVAAGGLGAIGWGVMGWRIARVRSRCTADAVDVMSVSEDDADMLVNSARDCFSAVGGNIGLWFLQSLPNGANWGIAPGGAAVRAKYDAARSVKTGEVDRKPGVFIGTGAALLSLGVVGRITVMVFQIQALNPAKSVIGRCIESEGTEVDEFFDCYSSNVSTRYAMHQLTSSAIAGGAGLLAYGVVYKRERRTYQKNFGAEPVARLEFSVQPQLSLGYTGIAANLRF